MRFSRAVLCLAALFAPLFAHAVPAPAPVPGPAYVRGCNDLQLECITPIGDADYPGGTLTVTSDQGVELTQPLTAPRTVTWFCAATENQGRILYVTDPQNFVSATNTLSIAPCPGDTINGSAGPYIINTSHVRTTLVRDSSTSWTASGTASGSGPSIFEPLSALLFGFVPDAHWGDGSCTWTSGTNVTLHCASGPFSSSDCHSGSGCTGPVDKSVTLNLADTGFAPYNSHISAFIDAQDVTVAGTVTNSSGYVLPSSIDVDGTNYGSGYLPGDTACKLIGGTPCGTVKVVQLVGTPGIHAAGAGGTNGAAFLMGTTPALAGEPFVVDATIAGGVVTAIGATERSGFYDNYTVLAGGEPVVAAIKDANGNWIADPSNPLAGATLDPSFGVSPGGLALVRSSTAISGFNCPNGAATSTSGGGTGLTIDCTQVTTTASWFTDNYPKVGALNTALQTYGAAMSPKCGYFPAGNYGFSQPPKLKVSGHGFFCGDSSADYPYLTNFFVAPNTAGDDVQITGCGRNNTFQPEGGTSKYSDPNSYLISGCGAVGLTFTHIRESTAHQNILMAYGQCIWCKIDIYGYSARGRGIGSGADAGGNSGWGESQIDFRLERVGDVDQNDGGGHVMRFQAVDLTALGNGTNNNLRIGCTSQARIYQSFGESIHIANEGAAGTGAHRIAICPGLHLEGSSMGPTGAGGTLIQLGDNSGATTDWPTLAGGTVSGTDGSAAHFSIWGQLSNPQYGFASLLTYNASDIQTNIAISGTGEALGNGIDHEGGCTGCSDSVQQLGSNGYGYILQGGGHGNTFSADGIEGTISTNIEAAQQPTGSNPVLFPAWTARPGFPTLSASTGLTAHAGGGQTYAALLTGAISNVHTVATIGDSVRLMPAWIGGCQFVINNSSHAMTVWGYSGSDLIDNAASFSQAGNSSRWYCVFAANNWQT